MITLRRAVFLMAMLGMGHGTGAFAQEYIVFNGGITLAEREAAPKTGTKLSFFVRAGHYLSNVKVIIINQTGDEMVNVVTDGPWLILNLPNGTYIVNATISSGEIQRVSFEVDGSSKEVGLMFTSVQ